MNTTRRTSKSQPRPIRRRVLGLVIATGVVLSGIAAVAPVAAQAAPSHLAPADTSTWG